MKKFLTLGLITMCIFGSSFTSNAQKIGYISADEIIVSMPEAAKVDTQLNQFQQALYQAAQDKQTAFNEAVAKFYKDSTTMNASLKEVKRTELQKQVQELSGAEQAIQQQFEQERQRLSLPIQRKLQAAIQDVARENGYTYVLPKEALLVMPPGDDLASLVRRKLNLKAPATTTRPTGTK
jgi:outer membrane protein